MRPGETMPGEEGENEIANEIDEIEMVRLGWGHMRLNAANDGPLW